MVLHQPKAMQNSWIKPATDCRDVLIGLYNLTDPSSAILLLYPNVVEGCKAFVEVGYSLNV